MGRDELVVSKIRLCKEKSCHNQQTTAGYCRYHYLKNWKNIKFRQKKQSVQALNRYIDHICTKNPDNYVAAVKRDLANPEFFSKQAENFLFDDDSAFLEELAPLSTDINKLIGYLKVDKSY